MLKTTLSTITALLITASTLNAEVGLSMGENGVTETQKGMAVIGNGQNSYQANNSYQEASPYPTQPVATAPQPYVENQSYEPAPQPAKVSGKYADAIIYARAVKSAYRVNEPIRVQLKLKKNAYIYFWTISRDGRGYLILPNRFEGYNKYKAYREYVVPHDSSDFQFISDRAGVEHLYVLATNKPINKSTISSIFSQRAGAIPRATASSIKKFVTKDLVVIAKRQSLKYDIKQFSINVLGNQTQNRPQQSNRPNVNIYIGK